MQPRRPHFIPEWVKRHGHVSQAEFAQAMGVDKSVVSRWYAGTSPSAEWQRKLAAHFGCQPQDIFAHPEESWFAKFLRDKSPDEIRRMKQMLELAFPPKTKG